MSSNPPSIPFVRYVGEPSQKDMLDLFRKDLMTDLNCHAIGTIQSFNSGVSDNTAPRAQVTINYKRTYYVLDTSTNQYVPELEDYPTLIDCPVVVLSGGGASLTMPIQQGDECLVLFNDRNLDNWMATGQIGPVPTPRLHAFSDAIVIVGVRSMIRPLTAWDAARAMLQNGTTYVGVSPDKVKIANQSTTLNTLLQNILTQLENLATAAAAITVTGVTSGGSASGPPANAATFTTISTQLTSLATQLGDLIE